MSDGLAMKMKGKMIGKGCWIARMVQRNEQQNPKQLKKGLNISESDISIGTGTNLLGWKTEEVKEKKRVKVNKYARD